MSFKQSIPASKADVYVSPSTNWVEAARQAKEAGFQFVTHEVVVSSGSGYIVAVDDDGYSVYASGVYAEGPQLNYNDLPEVAPSKVTFESRVLEFINDPARSDRNGLYQRLANDRFFASQEPKQREIIDAILKSGVFCKPGQEKFRQHMGDLMPEPTVTFTVTMPRDAAEAFGGGYDMSRSRQFDDGKRACQEAIRKALV
jgi:hypothetical protein